MAVVGDPRGFYQALGVGRTASPDEIRAAFRERAKLYHPDGGGGADEDQFRRLREAYEVLRDPQRRLQYDADSLEAERRREKARWGEGTAWDEGTAARERGLGAASAAFGRVARTVSPTVLLLGLAAVLAVGLVVAVAVAFGLSRDAARLSAEVGDLRTRLESARAAAIPTAAPVADPTPPIGGGEDALYTASIAFPVNSAELDGRLRDQLQARVSELRAAIGILPPQGTWTILVDGYSDRAASDTGVAVDEWELSLLRVATVTEFLVQAFVPPERLAVRFLAGSAKPDPRTDRGRAVALTLLCCGR